ncbi:uncharacterized protein [Henckelia pumila]|uniref:uncharacterized protein isoform X2 n=1 Tax=Henckelia pumila TaxID=405737 RepID=UPI003C6E060F
MQKMLPSTFIWLQNNEISGCIPTSIVRLEKLETLDLSNNKLTDEIPESNNLNYLRLNNNRTQQPYWYLSYNNLTKHLAPCLKFPLEHSRTFLTTTLLASSLPKVSARTFKIVGNPLICGQDSQKRLFCCLPRPSHPIMEKNLDQNITLPLLLELALVLPF